MVTKIENIRQIILQVSQKELKNMILLVGEFYLMLEVKDK